MAGDTPRKKGRWRLNVTQKIVAGYLALAIFSFGALIIALVAIKRQEETSAALVQRDFRAITLLRDLRTGILAEERLERQYLILGDPALLALRESRHADLQHAWQQLETLGLEDLAPLEAQARHLFAQEETIRNLLRAPAPQQSRDLLEQTIAPLRATLEKRLEQNARSREQIINASLQQLYTSSAQAYRLTLTVLILGIAIGGGIAIRVVQSIRASLRRLTEAVRQTAEERFDHSLDEIGDDEFGRLAAEFVKMGIKLRDLKHHYLDANPLTHLPGNLAIDRELERRIAGGELFAHIYIDLDHFKAYGDRYGYQKGSDVIAAVGEIIRKSVLAYGNPEDLVGHIGGDDYLVLTTPDCSEPIARDIIALFERYLPTFYTAEDFATGSYEGIDRFGEQRVFPLLSMSIAIIHSDNYSSPTHQLISEESAKMKEHLKQLPGSNYLIDRRRR